MKVGLVLPHLGTEATQDSIVKMALGAETEGFDSLWVSERLLWPVNPQTPVSCNSRRESTNFLSKII